jgi:hypothetical protein
MMPEYIYRHSHGCSHVGEVVHVYPEVRGTVFYLIPPRCVETGTELELVEAKHE